MVFTNGVFTTGVIEACEEKIIACFGIPGAFLYIDYKEGDIFVLLWGQLAKLMVLIESNFYCMYAQYSNGKAKL